MQPLRPVAIPGHRFFNPADIAPDRPFWAIGDVHGRYDLLAPLLDDVLKRDEPVVLLGDYINKGGQSAQVLRLIKQACDSGQVTALRGNHEELLIRFIARPRVAADHFRLYGGNKTFESFGITGLQQDMAAADLSKYRDQLVENMGDLADWLPTCPYLWQSGNIVALHAGADPAQGIDEQPAISFPWGHPHFDKQARQDRHWIVHGHRPVSTVEVKAGRIAINTNADGKGRLTAIRISRGQIEIR